MSRPAPTPTTDAALTKRVRRRILARSAPCRCGCEGGDSWHARTFDRVVRHVTTTLAAPQPVSYGSRYVSRYVEVARGLARFPWSPDLQPVRALAFVYDDGRLALYCDWELIDLRR